MGRIKYTITTLSKPTRTILPPFLQLKDKLYVLHYFLKYTPH